MFKSVVGDIATQIGEARQRFRNTHCVPPKEYWMSERRARTLCWEMAHRTPLRVFSSTPPAEKIFNKYWKALKDGELYVYGVNIKLYGQ
jgi:hypothetical protein